MKVINSHLWKFLFYTICCFNFIGFIVDDVTDDDREFRLVRRAVDTLGDVIDRYGDAGRDMILKLTNINFEKC